MRCYGALGFSFHLILPRSKAVGFNRRMRKTACPVVWEGGGAQSPSLYPIQEVRRTLSAGTAGLLGCAARGCHGSRRFALRVARYLGFGFFPFLFLFSFCSHLAAGSHFAVPCLRDFGQALVR